MSEGDAGHAPVTLATGERDLADAGRLLHNFSKGAFKGLAGAEEGRFDDGLETVVLAHKLGN